MNATARERDGWQSSLSLTLCLCLIIMDSGLFNDRKKSWLIVFLLCDFNTFHIRFHVMRVFTICLLASMLLLQSVLLQFIKYCSPSQIVRLLLLIRSHSVCVCLYNGDVRRITCVPISLNAISDKCLLAYIWKLILVPFVIVVGKATKASKKSTRKREKNGRFCERFFSAYCICLLHIWMYNWFSFLFICVAPRLQCLLPVHKWLRHLDFTSGRRNT